jgi:hypothetical protein
MLFSDNSLYIFFNFEMLTIMNLALNYRVQRRLIVCSLPTEVCWRHYVVPVICRESPYVCETSKLPNFLGNGSQMAMRLELRVGRPPLPPERFPALISVGKSVDPRDIVRLNWKMLWPYGNRSRDLPACSALPQPTTLQRAFIHAYIK